jgi:hypothetical protein
MRWCDPPARRDPGASGSAEADRAARLEAGPDHADTLRTDHGGDHVSSRGADLIEDPEWAGDPEEIQLLEFRAAVQPCAERATGDRTGAHSTG